MTPALRKRLISIALPLIILVIFVIQNIEIIHVKFLMWELSMPRSLMIFLVLLIGVIVGVVFRSAIVDRAQRGLKTTQK